MNNNSSVHAFFVGRAIAQALYQQLEQNLTTALSELGKFDAEQRERLRDFATTVMQRADMETQNTPVSTPSSAYSRTSAPNSDLQATIDELRAEIAEMRVQLQRYRSTRIS
ncbi:hypothetical protein NG798_11900 [Ancylothrix sp. C2]|uniref:DUF6825 family protein n=1 Tax=Ancylothrix sp. D3o TaxID=2953691 RepID=UPI0021BB71F0|nr:hypothetical protein [Ancylothrix sp. D3o]MCT7950495.1 hypothetical protein [Ancylothrix sp. D3o]